MTLTVEDIVAVTLDNRAPRMRESRDPLISGWATIYCAERDLGKSRPEASRIASKYIPTEE